VKVVLDTNVFVSGVFFGGVPGRILEAWRDGQLTLLVSVTILDEYRRVGRLLAQQYEGVELEPVLALVTVNAEVVEAPDLPEQVCGDPDDDSFLACAVAGGGAVVVSGDKALRAVSGWNGIEVLSPRGFADRYLS
jgi:putative PIN family toxin of toxin-antitoxin system